jgi:hypothetical protein
MANVLSPYTLGVFKIIKQNGYYEYISENAYPHPSARDRKIRLHPSTNLHCAEVRFLLFFATGDLLRRYFEEHYDMIDYRRYRW